MHITNPLNKSSLMVFLSLSNLKTRVNTSNIWLYNNHVLSQTHETLYCICHYGSCTKSFAGYFPLETSVVGSSTLPKSQWTIEQTAAYHHPGHSVPAIPLQQKAGVHQDQNVTPNERELIHC